MENCLTETTRYKSLATKEKKIYKIMLSTRNDTPNCIYGKAMRSWIAETQRKKKNKFPNWKQFEPNNWVVVTRTARALRTTARAREGEYRETEESISLIAVASVGAMATMRYANNYDHEIGRFYYNLVVMVDVCTVSSWCVSFDFVYFDTHTRGDTIDLSISLSLSVSLWTLLVRRWPVAHDSLVAHKKWTQNHRRNDLWILLSIPMFFALILV